MFKTLKRFEVEEFKGICDDLIQTSKRGKISNRKREWLLLIEAGNLTCPCSNLKVSYIGYDEKAFRHQPNTYHYNFYSECGRMFTIDHKIPKSKGGKQCVITNIQPMIKEYNHIKSNRNLTTSEITEIYNLINKK